MKKFTFEQPLLARGSTMELREICEVYGMYETICKRYRTIWNNHFFVLGFSVFLSPIINSLKF